VLIQKDKIKLLALEHRDRFFAIPYHVKLIGEAPKIQLDQSL